MIKKTVLLKMLLAVVVLGLSADGKAQKNALPKTIMVKGSVEFVSPKGPDKVWLYRDVMSGKPKLIDSAVVSEQNKSFTFKIKQDHPGIYKLDALHWDEASFWSDADVQVNMRGYDTARVHMKIPHYNFVEGSMDNNFINLFEQIQQLNYLRFVDEYNLQYYAKQNKKNDSAWITYLNTKHRYDSLTADLRMRTNVLFRVYKDRPVLLYALRSDIGPQSSDKYDDALKYLDKLIVKYPWFTEAKEAKQTIITNREMAAKVQSGKPVPSISYPDANGNLQRLEKYKGNYLLIDFWASWCGPCRQSIPKVKELYAEYHPKGFDVLSVSIDKDESAWRKAMQEEKMPWEQLLSPDMDQTMKKFQFSGIPTMYLIDPNGKIIRSYTGYSPEAEANIKSILKNKTLAPKERKSVPMASF
jgi:thiol-disulfide isomerase/thioredoxin